jgi:cell division protein YceG involved in septum cleavage
VLALLAIGAALYVINETFQPLHGEGRGAVRVSVPAGAGAGRIGEILEDRGVVENGRFFSLNATLTRRRGKLRTGDYTLPRRLSNGAAIEALIRGPKVKAIKTFNLTIPEGRSARETAGRLKNAVDGDYLAATRSPARLRRARRLGLPRGSKTLEGYLFPATYELPEGTTASELVDRQLSGYRDNTAKLSYTLARRRELTRYDVLIIASMIEREVQLDRERRWWRR